MLPCFSRSAGDDGYELSWHRTHNRCTELKGYGHCGMSPPVRMNWELNKADVQQSLQSTKKRRADEATRIAPIARFLKVQPVVLPEQAQQIAAADTYALTPDAIEAGRAVLATKPGTVVLEQQTGGVRVWARRGVQGFAVVVTGLAASSLLL